MKLNYYQAIELNKIYQDLQNQKTQTNTNKHKQTKQADKKTNKANKKKQASEQK